MPEPKPKIRLHLDAPLAEGAQVALEQPAANYLFAVMRLAPGDRLLAFNGRDGEWLAQVEQAGKRAGRLVALERTRAPEPPPDLWLFFAPIKKARTDFIVEKATELGCRRVQPALTQRTQSERVNIERLQAHAVEAAEQCELVFVPQIAPPAPLFQALEALGPERRLYFCDETRSAPPLIHAARPGPAAILIGPEGGFTPEEAARLRAMPRVTPVSLGPRVLRADTAAAAAISVWQSAVGDWRETSDAATSP